MTTVKINSAVLVANPTRLIIRGNLSGQKPADKDRIYVLQYAIRPWAGKKASPLNALMGPLCVSIGSGTETAITHTVEIPRVAVSVHPTGNRAIAIEDGMASKEITKVELVATLYETGFLRDGKTTVTDITGEFR